MLTILLKSLRRKVIEKLKGQASNKLRLRRTILLAPERHSFW